MTAHDHYLELSATSPYDMGMALGKAVGTALKPYLESLAPLPENVREYIAECFELTRREFPDYAAEIEGYAAGAGVGADVLWHMLLEDDVHALTHEKCTSFVCNEGQLIGHNEDWSAGAKNRLFIVRRARAGRTKFELHYAGTLGGNSVSVNSDGIVQMINSVDAIPLNMSTLRIPTNVIARFLADSTDFNEALARIKELPRMGGYAHTLVNAKQYGECRIVEISKDEIATRVVKDFPFVHANHYILDEMTALNQESGRAGSSRPRYAAATARTKRQMSSSEVISVLEDTSGVPDCGIKNSRTIASIVIDLADHCAWVHLSSEIEKAWQKYSLDFIGRS